MKAEPDTTRDGRIEHYIALTVKKRKIEAELRAVKDDIAPLESWIADDFAQRRCQSINLDGHTVYLRRDLSVKSKGGDTAAIVDKLRRARLGELIGVNWPRIKAWVKERCYREDIGEWQANTSKLPPSLRDVVDVEEYVRVCCKKS